MLKYLNLFVGIASCYYVMNYILTGVPIPPQLAATYGGIFALDNIVTFYLRTKIERTESRLSKIVQDKNLTKEQKARRIEEEWLKYLNTKKEKK